MQVPTTASHLRPAAFGGAIAAWMLLAGLLGSTLFRSATWVDAAMVPEPPNEPPPAYTLEIPLPLAAGDDDRLRTALDALSQQQLPGPRPVVILQFVPQADRDRRVEGPLGRGTPFERALGLARWLSGPQANRIKTVAYLSQALEGHAVLVALACEEIAMASDAQLGRAGIDEPQIDNTLLQAYQDIATRRRTLPPTVIAAMLAASSGIWQVNLSDGQRRFVDREQLDAVRETGEVLREEQVVVAGRLATFSGQQLRSWQWIEYLVRDADALSAALQVQSDWQDLRRPIGEPDPVLIELFGRLAPRNIAATLRALEEAVGRDRKNTVIVSIDSPGGNLAAAFQLAQALAELPDRGVQTVALITGQALGDAALIPLSCQRIYMLADSRIGGPGAASIQPRDVVRVRDSFSYLADRTRQPVGLMQVLVCPPLEVYQYRRADGRIDYSTIEDWSEQEDATQWTRGERVVVGEEGVAAEEAAARGWSSGTLLAPPELANILELQSLPRPKLGSRVEEWVARLAALQWLAPLLIFFGFLALLNELSAPGIGVAGFVSVCCFMMFFWLRLLDGTVEGLELLLFIGGLASLAVEIFVLPGFGIFGFGGLLMVAAAIVLASQTFVLPTNPYQMNQLAWNTAQVAGIGLSLVIGVILLRKRLAKMPFYRHLALEQADPRQLQEHEYREQLVHWEHLVGQVGITTTPLIPSGKVRFGDELLQVVSDGTAVAVGQAVRVLEVIGNRIVVEPIEEATA
jgi:membrane-bound serine protease (ClpP class)